MIANSATPVPTPISPLYSQQGGHRAHQVLPEQVTYYLTWIHIKSAFTGAKIVKLALFLLFNFRLPWAPYCKKMCFKYVVHKSLNIVNCSFLIHLHFLVYPVFKSLLHLSFKSILLQNWKNRSFPFFLEVSKKSKAK